MKKLYMPEFIFFNGNNMGLSDSLSKASTYTGGLFKRLGDLVILIILAIIPILNFIFLGYWGRVVSDNPSSADPPRVEKYGDMFVSGLKYFAVGLIWGIILLIIAIVISLPFIIAFIAAAGGAIISGNITNFAQMLPALVVFVPYIVIMIIVIFFLGIVIHMGLVHMFKTGSFGKAFAFGEIFRIIGKIGWISYLAYFVVYFFISMIVAVFSAIPWIGWLITLILSPIVQIFMGRTIGLMYDEAVGTRASPPAVASPPPPPAPEQKVA